MSIGMIVLIGVVVVIVLILIARRSSVQQPDQKGDTQYIRPHVVAPSLEPPVVSPELERLNNMQLAGTISQAEYNILRERFVDQDAPAPGGLCTLTITAGTDNKIRDIKAIREATHLGLKDAKDVADAIPQVLARDLPRQEIVRMQQILERAGIQTRIN